MLIHDCAALVVGAGPSGLVTATDLAIHGVDVLVVDSCAHPGGQLVKQIHKFFGTAQHFAGMRGVDIASRLVEQALAAGVRILLEHRVIGALAEGVLVTDNQERLSCVRCNQVILAVGALERPAVFPGWTLPGVMTAGAIQTFVNVHRIMVGARVLVMGSGNVGLIVAYQLTQAGIEVAAVVESRAEIGGWGVHASKIRRLGIPIHTGMTVREAIGSDHVEGAILASTQAEKTAAEMPIRVDTICQAVGLSPNTRLAQQIGCRLVYAESLGGFVPAHDRLMQTTVPGWFVAGDAAGVEEATIAIEEGHLAAIGVLTALRRNPVALRRQRSILWKSLDELRGGSSGLGRRHAKEAICLGVK